MVAGKADALIRLGSNEGYGVPHGRGAYIARRYPRAGSERSLWTSCGVGAKVVRACMMRRAAPLSRDAHGEVHTVGCRVDLSRRRPQERPHSELSTWPPGLCILQTIRKY